MKIDLKKSKTTEITAEELEVFKLRIENWRRCYEDKQVTHVSFLARKIMEHEAATMIAAGLTLPGQRRFHSLDLDDADLLQEAWRRMDEDDPEEIRRIAPAGMSPKVAKNIVFIYAFAGNRYRNVIHQYRRAILHVSDFRFYKNSWEECALRFFAKTVHRIEHEKSMRVSEEKK